MWVQIGFISNKLGVKIFIFIFLIRTKGPAQYRQSHFDMDVQAHLHFQVPWIELARWLVHVYNTCFVIDSAERNKWKEEKGREKKRKSYFL